MGAPHEKMGREKGGAQGNAELEHRATCAATILHEISLPAFVRATFGGAQRLQKSPTERAVVRPVTLRGGRQLQITRFDGRKDVSTNHTAEELPSALADILAIGFAN